jgi:DNA mismatch repair protein MutS
LPQVQEAAEAVALVDMLACFASLALERDYVRPQVHDGDELTIHEGRHPVVECVLDAPFVPNDTDLDLDSKRIMIVTGPNMAGKSTYLRQTALIVLMAQIGSYVPATSASIGVVDRIYTRVGASDNLARGQSTFLVEMLETAAILNSAGARSLLIMDEIGRGTSTYDGLAIAWSIIEFLHQHPERGGRTLFATHYHELTVLGEEHGIGNLNVEVREWNDQVIFLKKVVPGSADKSYGIHVARLAGLPPPVITRARQILRELEEKTRELDEEHHRGQGDALQLPLFKPYEQEVLSRIRDLDPDYLTPMEAHLLLAEFKEKL